MKLIDAIGTALWVAALGLVILDVVLWPHEGCGPLAPFGGLVALAAVVASIEGIARRYSEKVVNDLHACFDIGREVERREGVQKIR